MKSEQETNEREMTIHDLFCEDIEFLFEPDEKCEAIKVERVGVLFWLLTLLPVLILLTRMSF